MSWFAFLPRGHGRGHMQVRDESASQRARHIRDAYEALTRAAALASQLESEIAARQTTLKAIEADIAAKSVLSSIDQGQAAGIVELVDVATEAAHQRLLRASRVDQIIFFVSGVVVSTGAQLLLSWLGL